MTFEEILEHFRKNRYRDSWPRKEYEEFCGFVMFNYKYLLDYIDRLEHSNEWSEALTVGLEEYSDPEVWSNMPVLLPNKLNEEEVKKLYDYIKTNHPKLKGKRRS